MISLFGLLVLCFAALVRCDACTDKATWTIKDFSATFSEEVQTGGKASFTLVNDVKGTSDKLTCSLRANSRCEITGTPSDKNLHLLIQIFIGMLDVSLDSEIECDGVSVSVLHVLEVPLTCPEPSACTLDEATVKDDPPALAPPDFQLPDTEP